MSSGNSRSCPSTATKYQIVLWPTCHHLAGQRPPYVTSQGQLLVRIPG